MCGSPTASLNFGVRGYRNLLAISHRTASSARRGSSSIEVLMSCAISRLPASRPAAAAADRTMATAFAAYSGDAPASSRMPSPIRAALARPCGVFAAIQIGTAARRGVKARAASSMCTASP